MKRPISLSYANPRVSQSPLARGEPRVTLKTVERGYDENWKRCRNNHLLLEPLCRHCSHVGKAVPGNEVDHIIDIVDAPHLRLDDSNLQTLCTTHHRIKTRATQLRKGTL